MAKSRKTPTSPFVRTIATVGLSLSFAPACGNALLDSDDDGMTTNPPFPPPTEPSCPEEQPAAGSACSGDLSCAYPGWQDDCGNQETTVATCEAGAWTIIDPGPSNCNPPAPSCPDEPPEPGSACSEDVNYGPYDCSYTVDIGCGEQDANYTCSGDSWSESVATCNPPPPDFCPDIATPAECDANPDCQWLVPGCGVPALPAAGCFSAFECAADTCDPGLTCQTAVVDPCWDQTCEACGLEVQVCLP